MTNERDDQPRRGRPRSRKSRDSILSAVRQELLSGGYASLTMERVAAKAGVSKATIYRWWSTKGELALEAAESEISIGVVPDTGSSERDMDIAVQQLIETFSRPLASIVIFAAITTAGSDPVMAQVFRDNHVYPWRRSAAQALERAINRGDVKEEDAQFILDVIVGTVFQRILVLKEPMVEGLKQKLLSLVFRT